MILILFLLNW
jgi:Type I restriction-modification system methyltransferase subunit